MTALSKIESVAVAILAVAASMYISDPSLQAVEENADQAELPNRHPRMVHEYFITRLKQIEKNADKKRNAITTKQQAEAYVSEVRPKIDDCFGPWPERTPLNTPNIRQQYELWMGELDAAGVEADGVVYSTWGNPDGYQNIEAFAEVWWNEQPDLERERRP